MFRCSSMDRFVKEYGLQKHLDLRAYYTEHKMTKISTLDFLKDLQQTMDSSTSTIKKCCGWPQSTHQRSFYDQYFTFSTIRET